MDPGGVHAGGAGEPSGLGHVRLRLLLRHDFYLDGGVRLRGASQQRQLGCSSKSSTRITCCYFALIHLIAETVLKMSSFGAFKDTLTPEI